MSRHIVPDPVGVDPDSDLTFKKRLDLDSTIKKIPNPDPTLG